MSTKIKTTNGWETTANPACNIPKKSVLLWQGSEESRSYAAGWNSIGSFILPKGKWLLRTQLYTVCAWIRLGSAPDNATYFSYRSYDGNDRNTYLNMDIPMTVSQDTRIYINMYRAAAGTSNIWARQIYGIKLD